MSNTTGANHRSTDNAREIDRPRDRPRDKPRDPAEPHEVDRFRNLLQGQHGQHKTPQELRMLGREDQAQSLLLGENGKQPATVTDDAVQAKAWDDGGDQDGDQDAQQGPNSEALRPSELAALYQAQVIAREAPTILPAAAPPAQTNPQALADMLERHVRQLAVSPNASADDKGQVLLRLNDATLPGTDLLLSRTERGWLLRADVRSRSSFDAIQQAAPKLAERFANRNLGELEVDPQFHG